MIPRFSRSYNSMCRSIALPCLIELGRSGVISCHSQDVGSMYTRGKWIRNNVVMYENGGLTGNVIQM
jgi:hypothetical protein